MTVALFPLGFGAILTGSGGDVLLFESVPLVTLAHARTRKERSSQDKYLD